jgi:hypothetical protein
MTKKRLLLSGGGLLIALLLVGLVGATVVFAQEPTPDPEALPRYEGKRGGGLGFGRGMFGMARGGQWTMFDTAAEVLGLTPEDLFAELHGGKSLDEVAEDQGVEMEAVQDALRAARVEAMQEAIEQAVEDGRMTQEQADWLLEGLEKGFAPMGRGFGRGRGRGGLPCPDPDDA